MKSLFQQRDMALATKICREIMTSETPPSFKELAQRAGMSPFHFHRVFKNVIGLTPKQYAAACRLGKVRLALRMKSSVTEAMLDAGFQSNSRFYERIQEVLGMTPTAYQRKGDGVQIEYTIAPSALGLVLVAGTSKGLCAVRFGSDRALLERELKRDFSKAEIQKTTNAVFREWVRCLLDHLKDPASQTEIPLDIRGTAFQQRVWGELRKISVGQTATYSQIAKRIGHPTAVRAVAQACGRNPVAVVIPCHRVIGAGGQLTGYHWGIERKKKLLRNEMER